MIGRAQGKVVDGQGHAVTGLASIYRETELIAGWYGLQAATGMTQPVHGKPYFYTDGHDTGLVNASAQHEAGYFDVPGGLEWGALYRFHVHDNQGRERWTESIVFPDDQPVLVHLEGGSGVSSLGPNSFVLGASYFGGSSCSDATIEGDLDYLQSKHVGLIRVWVCWDRGLGGGHDRVYTRDGSPGPAMNTFRRLLDVAAEHAMGVDVTFQADGFDRPGGQRDVVAQARAVRHLALNFGNHPALRMVDLGNECNVASRLLSASNTVALASTAWAIDPQLTVTASVSDDVAPTSSFYQGFDTGGALFGGRFVAAPHFPRVAGWGTNLANKVQTLRASLQAHVSSAHLDIYCQEEGRERYPNPASTWPDQQYIDALIGARASNTLCYVFHTDARFDQPGMSFESRLSPKERGILTQLAALV